MTTAIYYDKDSDLFFEVCPDHRNELQEYFVKLDKLNIKYNITGDAGTWNPMMSNSGNCVYSLKLIKKSLDRICASV